jgi:hypothetical protein
LDDFVTHGLAISDPSGEFYLGLALRAGFRTFGREEKITVGVTLDDAANPSGKLVK